MYARLITYIIIIIIILCAGALILKIHKYNESKKMDRMKFSVQSSVYDYYYNRDKNYNTNQAKDLYDKRYKSLDVGSIILDKRADIVTYKEVNVFFVTCKYYVWVTNEELIFFPTRSFLDDYSLIDLNRIKEIRFKLSNIGRIYQDDGLLVTHLDYCNKSGDLQTYVFNHEDFYVLDRICGALTNE